MLTVLILSETVSWLLLKLRCSSERTCYLMQLTTILRRGSYGRGISQSQRGGNKSVTPEPQEISGNYGWHGMVDYGRLNVSYSCTMSWLWCKICTEATLATAMKLRWKVDIFQIHGQNACWFSWFLFQQKWKTQTILGRLLGLEKRQQQSKWVRRRVTANFSST